jgi:hypothetical protein
MDTRLTVQRKEKTLETTVRKEIESLRHMTVGQLKEKYAEVFGERPRAVSKAYRFSGAVEGGRSSRLARVS